MGPRGHVSSSQEACGATAACLQRPCRGSLRGDPASAPSRPAPRPASPPRDSPGGSRDPAPRRAARRKAGLPRRRYPPPPPKGGEDPWRVWPRAELRHLLLSRFLRVRIRHVKLPDPLSSPSSKPERCLPSRIVGVRSQYSFSSQQGRRAWEGRALGIHLLLLLLFFHSFKHLLLRPQP